MKFPKLHKTDEAQEMYTPSSAVRMLFPYIDKQMTYYDCCFGAGHIVKALEDGGYKCIGRDISYNEIRLDSYDCIITNPPFRDNKKFLYLCKNSYKPFAILLRLEHLGGVRAWELLKDFEFSVFDSEA